MDKMKLIAPFMYPKTNSMRFDIGLLIARITFRGMMFLAHGLGKLTSFRATIESGAFPDPIGIGSTASFVLATGAEFFCALFLVFGIATRLQAIPLAITMIVATFFVNIGNIPADAASIGEMIHPSLELSLLFLMGYIMIAITGPGRFSVDALLFKKR